MNTDTANRIAMLKTTAAYLEAHNAVWSSMAPMATAVEGYRQTLTAIDASAQKQQAPSGAAEDKTEARDALEDVTFLMCEALGVLAQVSGDHDLTALAAVRESDLTRATAEELSNLAANILAAANARKSELMTVQVTQANIDELDQSLRTFNAAKTAPRSAIAERSVHTKSVTTLVREAQMMLRNSIDRFVNLFRRTDPDFVAGYKAARVIVDRPASRSARKPEDDKPETPEK